MRPFFKPDSRALGARGYGHSLDGFVSLFSKPQYSTSSRCRRGVCINSLDWLFPSRNILRLPIAGEVFVSINESSKLFHLPTHWRNLIFVTEPRLLLVFHWLVEERSRAIKFHPLCPPQNKNSEGPAIASLCCSCHLRFSVSFISK